MNCRHDDWPGPVGDVAAKVQLLVPLALCMQGAVIIKDAPWEAIEDSRWNRPAIAYSNEKRSTTGSPSSSHRAALKTERCAICSALQVASATVPPPSMQTACRLQQAAERYLIGCACMTRWQRQSRMNCNPAGATIAIRKASRASAHAYYTYLRYVVCMCSWCRCQDDF